VKLPKKNSVRVSSVTTLFFLYACFFFLVADVHLSSCFFFFRFPSCFCFCVVLYSYGSQSCSIILYVVRLMVRLEGYVLFIQRHTQWHHEHAASSSSSSSRLGAGPDSYVRGLDPGRDCPPEAYARIQAAASMLRRRVILCCKNFKSGHTLLWFLIAIDLPFSLRLSFLYTL